MCALPVYTRMPSSKKARRVFLREPALLQYPYRSPPKFLLHDMHHKSRNQKLTMTMSLGGPHRPLSFSSGTVDCHSSACSMPGGVLSRRAGRKPCSPSSRSLSGSPVRRQLASTAAANNNDDNAINPYKLLQIRKDATQGEIKHTYRRLALLYHPGRSKHLATKETERRRKAFTMLSACCETLLERDSRARLDNLLAQQRKRTAPPLTASNSMKETTSQKQQGLPFLTRTFSDSSHEDEHWDWPCTRAASTASHPVKHNGHCNQHKQQQQEHLKSVPQVLKSCSTEEMDSYHYTQAETNRLFGGPLSLLYQARSFQPFSDPYVIFERVFGSAVFPREPDVAPSTPPTAVPREEAKLGATTASTRTSMMQQLQQPLLLTNAPSHSDAWTGSSETLPDGTMVYTITRIVNHRKMTKRECIRVDPVTGQTKSSITVVGEDISLEEDALGDFENGKETAPKINMNDTSITDGYTYWSCCDPTMFFSPLGSSDDDNDETYDISDAANNRSIFRRMWCMI